MSEKVIATFRGPEHCGWESAVFLHLGRPLVGEDKGPEASRRTYVRDPGGLFQDHVRVPFDEDARVPPDGRYTGYHLGDVELWISPKEEESAVYVVRRDRAERWPRLPEGFACA